MAVTAYKNPGTLASVNNSKPTAQTWLGPENAGASDDSYAQVSLIDKDRPTYWLRGTNFGFTAGDIPAGATIDIIELVVERKMSRTGEEDQVWDDDVFLRKTSGQVGTDHASGNLWPEADAEATYTFTFADHGLAQTDIVSADFGCDFGAWLDFSYGVVAYVDCVKVRVNYTAPSGRQPRPTPMTPCMVA